MKKIIMANPRGFCAGVDRAIAIVENALTLFGAPIYVKHEVVHNRQVVEGLRARGTHFIEDIAEVPNDSVLIFSAHGVSQAVRKQAASRSLQVFDATCPLVTKVHMEVARLAKKDYEVVLIGHKGHPEVAGTMGQYNSDKGGIYLVENCQQAEQLTVNNCDTVHYVTQTTLSYDDSQAIIKVLKRRFVKITGPKRDDICYATQNRQDAVKQLAPQVDVMVVVGSATSSNSNRLQELSEQLGTASFLVDEVAMVKQQQAILQRAQQIGVTAGASAPACLVQDIVAGIQDIVDGDVVVEQMHGKEETIHFSLPKALRLPVREEQ